MKKCLLILVAGVFGILTANAYTVTDNGDGSVTIDGGGYETITQVDTHGVQHTIVSGATGAGLPNQFTDAQINMMSNASKLIFTGYIVNIFFFNFNTINKYCNVIFG